MNSNPHHPTAFESAFQPGGRDSAADRQPACARWTGRSCPCGSPCCTAPRPCSGLAEGHSPGERLDAHRGGGGNCLCRCGRRMGRIHARGAEPASEGDRDAGAHAGCRRLFGSRRHADTGDHSRPDGATTRQGEHCAAQGGDEGCPSSRADHQGPERFSGRARDAARDLQIARSARGSSFRVKPCLRGASS